MEIKKISKDNSKGYEKTEIIKSYANIVYVWFKTQNCNP